MMEQRPVFAALKPATRFILPWLQQFLHFCLPNCCLWCDLPVQQASAQLCNACQQALPRFTPPAAVPLLALPALRQGFSEVQFDALWALSWYQQPWSHFISGWKFQRDLACGDLLKQQLSAYLTQVKSDCSFDAVSFVPVHPKRLRERGFNQSEQLAAVAGDALGLPVLSLFRARQHQPHQVGASAVQRKAQLRHQFALLPAGILPASVLLVDDVITTGSTLNQLCRQLRRAGVKHIGVCCLCVTAAPGLSLQLYSSPSSPPAPASNI